MEKHFGSFIWAVPLLIIKLLPHQDFEMPPPPSRNPRTVPAVQ